MTPDEIQILPDGLSAALKTMELASLHNLTARRIHDARHAAAALAAGVTTVYTYDVEDWKLFAGDGLCHRRTAVGNGAYRRHIIICLYELFLCTIF